MRVLAVDTSSSLGSVAIVVDGVVVAEVAASVSARHGETLLPHIERALALARLALHEMDLLAVGLGPGSFTGTRIGVASLKGLSLGAGIPIVGLSSLEVVAYGVAAGGSLVAPLVDAHKGEVYAAVYRSDTGGRFAELIAPLHDKPARAAENLRRQLAEQGLKGELLVLVGDATRRYEGELRGGFGEPHRFVSPVHDHPRAAHLAALALDRFRVEGASDADALEPIYARPSDAKLPAVPLRTDLTRR